jgi:hypothetical protein
VGKKMSCKGEEEGSRERRRGQREEEGSRERRRGAERGGGEQREEEGSRERRRGQREEEGSERGGMHQRRQRAKQAAPDCCLFAGYSRLLPHEADVRDTVLRSSCLPSQDLLSSTSQVVGLKMCTTIPS